MSKNSIDAGSAHDPASMDQVRELLFGSQLKDMEMKFQRQEERFLREIADSRDALKQRIDSLEKFMKSETSSLMNRLNQEKNERENVLKDEARTRTDAIKAEQSERSDALKAEQKERAEAMKVEQKERADAVNQLIKDLNAMQETFDRKLTKLSATLDSTERELRELLMSESSTLSDKVEEKYQDSLDVLRETAAQIRHDMVYRTNLSGMFTDIAVKLSGRSTSDLTNMLRNSELQQSRVFEEGPVPAPAKKGAESK